MNMICIKKSILWLFVAVFGIMIVGVNYGFMRAKDNEAAAKFENRTITKFPSVSIRKKEFYTEFEKWYSDRMYKRQEAIFLWRKGKYAIGVVEPKNIIIGENDWLLSKRKFVKYIDDEKKTSKLKEMQMFCEQNGAKFLIMFAPYKDLACKRYYPYAFRKKIVDHFQISDVAVKSLQANGVDYVDTCSVIMKAMEHDDPEHTLYVKDDHHWSYFGAMIAADLLLNKMDDMIGIEYDHVLTDGTILKGTKECSRWKKLGLGNEKQRSIGDVPWHEKYTKNLEIIYSHNGKVIHPKKPIANSYLWEPMLKGEGIIINRDKKNGRTMLMLTDSYGTYMMPYLSQYFKSVVCTHYLRKDEKKQYTNMRYLLERYKPDIVVLFSMNYLYRGVDSTFKNLVYE